jgi:guanylate kinase
MTTRSPRVGETNGVEYHFVSKEDFLNQIEKGNLLEYAEFCDNYYGTPLDKVNEQLESGQEVVLEIEVQGAMQVKEKMPDGVYIFIAPPSMKALEERLIHRGTEDQTIIQKRLQKARNEIKVASEYGYIVVNDTVENAADRIMAIIRAEHARTDRVLDEYKKLMEE